MKKNIEKIIDKVNGSMALEGMPLTEEDKQRIRNIDSGKTTSTQEIEKMNQKHLSVPQ